MAAPLGHLLNLSVILFFGLRGTPFILPRCVSSSRHNLGKSTSPKSDGKVRILGRQCWFSVFTGKSNFKVAWVNLSLYQAFDYWVAFNFTLWLLLVFSVTPFKIDQNKNQNRSIDKVQNLGNERKYIYKDPRQDEPTEASVTEVCYKSVNLFFERLINIKVILFLIHELFR